MRVKIAFNLNTHKQMREEVGVITPDNYLVGQRKFGMVKTQRRN